LAPTRLRIFPTLFPLFATIFLFLKKKQKGFSLQSGVQLQVRGIFQTFGLFLITDLKLRITFSHLQGFQNLVGLK
jgi:hypothetical protein